MKNQCKIWKNALVPVMHDPLQDALDKGMTWLIYSDSENFYEVHCEPSMFVNIEERICKCGKWQQHGFPCAHAAVALISSSYMTRNGITDYIKSYFFMNFNELVVSEPIHPVVTFGKMETVTSKVEILPPITRKLPGRPKKKMVPSRGENMQGVKCSRCDLKGRHNRKSCRKVIKN